MAGTLGKLSGIVMLVMIAALILLMAVQPMITALKTIPAAPIQISQETTSYTEIEIAAMLESVEIDEAYIALADQELYTLEANRTNVIVDPEYSHADEEHPQDAPIVRSCLASKGAYMQFQIEKNRRYLRVCIIDEVAGLIGFQIVDIVNRVAKERTAYIKDSIRCLKDLLRYTQRMGYPRFTKPL